MATATPAAPSPEQVHDLVTLACLVRVVDRQLADPARSLLDLDPLLRLQLDATLAHANQLVHSLSGASPTSTKLYRPRLDTLSARLATAQHRLDRLPRPRPRPRGASPAPSSPLQTLLDLIPPVDPPPPLDAIPWESDCTPSAASSSRPASPAAVLDPDADARGEAHAGLRPPASAAAPPSSRGVTSLASTKKKKSEKEDDAPRPASLLSLSSKGEYEEEREEDVEADWGLQSDSLSESNPGRAVDGDGNGDGEAVAVEAAVARTSSPPPASPPTPPSPPPVHAGRTTRTSRRRTPLDAASPKREGAHPGAEPVPVPAYLVAKRARAKAVQEQQRRKTETGGAEETEDEKDEVRAGSSDDAEADEGGASGGEKFRAEGTSTVGGGRGAIRRRGGRQEDDEGSMTRSTATPEGSTPASSGSTKTSQLASYHAAEQASLLSMLTSLSSTLKSSTLEFSTLLDRDREVVAQAERTLSGSEGKLKAQGKRLEGVRSRSRGTTCATLVILVGVVVLWILVFLLIKVS